MLNDFDKRRLETYFGFLLKSKGFSVGRKLETELGENQIAYLILFPDSCSDRSREDLKKLTGEDVCVLEYKGELNLHQYLKLKEVKAIGIHDAHLGKAIYDLLLEDNKGGC